MIFLSKKSSTRSFLSLRWKIFGGLIALLLAIHLCYGYYSYTQLKLQSKEREVEITERDIIILRGMVTSSYEHLLEIGEVIPLVLSTRSLSSNGRFTFIRQYFLNLLINGSLDAAYLFDEKGKIIDRQGELVTIPQSIIEEVTTNEMPSKYFHCAEVCLRFIAFPVNITNNRTGVMVVGKRMRDVILEFKNQSNRDIGLALQSPNPTSDLWELKLKYLTRKSENISLLKYLSSKQKISPEGGIYNVEHNGRYYQILLEPPANTTLGTAYWILIEDYTERYIAERNVLLKNLLISGIMLIITSLLLLALLRRPLKSLSEISSLLPLLASSAFNELRQQLQNLRQNKIYRDELDILRESTLSLSHQLENMESSLVERAQNLIERSVQLESERDFVSNLLNTAEAIILTLDNKGNIITLNRFGQELLGITPSEKNSVNFLDLDHDTKRFEKHREMLESLFSQQERKVQIESSVRSAIGQRYLISWLHSSLNVPGIPSCVLSIGLDFTERERAEKRLTWMANHDSLTSLPNRILFNEKVNEMITRVEGKNESFAVLFCDLDSFKDVNDSLGHPVGDELLLQTAERIDGVVLNNGVLARFSGDEFAVLLEPRYSIRIVEVIARHILQAFRRPFLIGGYEIFSTVSIGIAIFPEHGDDPTSLIQNADVAMFDAKENGKNQLRFYHDDQGSQRYERFSLANDLRRALEKEELRIHYQPKINARTGSVMGVEALLRWQHGEAGMISPAKFIPLAEEQGLIVPIGEWVLNEACLKGKEWHEQGMNIQIGVNVAGQQIMHESLLPMVERIINETRIHPNLLDLEVTESFLLRQPEVTVPKLHRLREMGVSLSMDDFGTGFSSLSYLKKLPLNTLKIDQSFVRDIGSDPDGEAIVKAIIVMAQSLGLKVLAEGVETADQLSYLMKHGCYLIQGYYFSRPLPADDLPEYIIKQAVEIHSEHSVDDTFKVIS